MCRVQSSRIAGKVLTAGLAVLLAGCGRSPVTRETPGAAEERKWEEFVGWVRERTHAFRGEEYRKVSANGRRVFDKIDVVDDPPNRSLIIRREYMSGGVESRHVYRLKFTPSEFRPGWRLVEGSVESPGGGKDVILRLDECDALRKIFQ